MLAWIIGGLFGGCLACACLALGAVLALTLWGAGETIILSQSVVNSIAEWPCGFGGPGETFGFFYLKLFFCSWGLSRLHAALWSSAADSGCFAANRRAVMQVGSEVLEEQQTNETEVDI